MRFAAFTKFRFDEMGVVQDGEGVWRMGGAAADGEKAAGDLVHGLSAVAQAIENGRGRGGVLRWREEDAAFLRIPFSLPIQRTLQAGL